MEHYALPMQVYGASLIFARVGALLMLLPGVGEATVPPRVRLAFAFTLSLVLYPVLRASLPPVPATLDAEVGRLVLEILIGLALGAILRLFLSTLAVAGEIVSLQTTLSFAQTANPLQAQPTPTVGAFLTLLGLTLIFATGMHQVFIAAIVRSYTLFAPTKALPAGDIAQLAIRATGESFALGLQLAGPVVVFSLVFNVAAGLIGRVMPQFQIFFAATPLAVLLGLSIFALTLGSLGMVWIDRLRAFTERFA